MPSPFTQENLEGRPKSYKDIEVAFNEKFDNGEFVNQLTQEISRGRILQFLKSSIQTALEAVEVKEEPIINRPVNTFEDGQVYGEVDGWNAARRTRQANIRNFMGEKLTK